MVKLAPKKVIALLALLAGGALLAKASYMQGKAWLAQALIEQAWQQGLAQKGGKHKPWYYADGHVTAKLNVPALGVERYILAGASGRNLAFAPAHALASSPLGEKGASVIAAHNDTHFAFLPNLVTGDELTLTLLDGTVHRYRVTQSQVVHQNDTHLADKHALYLVTCYPFESLAAGTPWRLLVEAVPVGSSSKSTTSA